MSEHTHVPDQPPHPAAAPVETTQSQPRLRDRVLGLRGVLAVALASLVLGGTGGAVLGAVSDGGDDSAGPGGFGGRGQLFAPNGAPGGQPGQQQGTTGAPVTGSLGGSAG